MNTWGAASVCCQLVRPSCTKLLGAQPTGAAGTGWLHRSISNTTWTLWKYRFRRRRDGRVCKKQEELTKGKFHYSSFITFGHQEQALATDTWAELSQAANRATCNSHKLSQLTQVKYFLLAPAARWWVALQAWARILLSQQSGNTTGHLGTPLCYTEASITGKTEMRAPSDSISS